MSGLKSAPPLLLLIAALLIALPSPSHAVAVEHSLLNSVIDGGGDTGGSSNYTALASVAQALDDTSRTSNYTFSLGFVAALADSYSGPIFYVATTGNDTNASGSITDPFRTITEALTRVSAGGTVSIAAGTYAETVAITKDNITIIGADSSVTGTILNFGDSDGTPLANGIYAQGRTGLIIKNLRIVNNWNGIKFVSVTASTIENVTVEQNGGCGVYLELSTGNTLKQVYANRNAYGVYLYNASTGNIIDELEADNSSQQGVRLELGSNQTRVANSLIWFGTVQGILVTGSSGNLIEGNDIRHNASDGVTLYNSTDNIVRHNRMRTNGYGLYFDSTARNLAYQNRMDSNQNYQIYFATRSSNDSAIFNNIKAGLTNPESGVGVDSVGATVTLKRNYWHTSDSVVVDSLVRGAGETLAVFYPFRFSPVDTSPGADSVAPKAPDSVSASSAGGTTVVVAWSTVTLNEDGYAGPINLSRYAIFRSGSQDTSFWAEVGQAPAGTLSFTDSGLAAATAYFYRIASEDTHTFANLSALSDSIASATTMGGGGAPLNPCDSLTKNGNFASAVSQNGSETDLGGKILFTANSGTPFIYQGVLIRSSAGDTIALFKYDVSGAELACTPAPSGNLSDAEDDTQGNLYIAGSVNSPALGSVGMVWKLDPNLNILTSLALTGEAGNVSAVHFGSNGRLYLWADGGGTTAKLLSYNASLTTRYSYAEVNFGSPNGAQSLIVDDSFGFIYVQGGESSNQRLRKYDLNLALLADTSVTQSAIYGGKIEVDTMSNVYLLAINSGETQATLYKYDSSLTQTSSVIVKMLGSPGIYSEPQLPEIDLAQDGFLYLAVPAFVTDAVGIVVRKYTSSLVEIDSTSFGAIDADAAYFLDVKDSSNIYVSGQSRSGTDWQSRAIKFSLIKVPPADTSGPNKWYVNDTATTGDSFTSAIGATTNDGLAPSSPRRYLADIEAHLSAGDTVYLDAGQYDEVDTFTISANGVFVIGKDSASTVVRFDQTAASAARALYATNVTNLTIRDLRVTNGRFGVWWKNVDASAMERVRSDTHGVYGIWLDTGTGSGSDSNTLTSNTASGNSNNGINLKSSSNNILTLNASLGNSNYGINIEASSNNNTLTSNTVSGNTSHGIFHDASSNNTLTSNTVSGNSNNGIYLLSSSNNTLTSNTVSGNSNIGIFLNSCSNNTLTSNTSAGNSNAGIYLSGSSSNNRLASNISRANNSDGYSIFSASNNIFVQNTADSNAGWAFFLDGTSATTADTFVKNVFIASPYPAFRDSGVYNSSKSNFKFDFSRNWWGTTDTAKIFSMIHGKATDSRALITFTPFRLDIVDTTPGADTVAPDAPDTVSAAGVDSQSILVTWSAVATNEEPASGSVNLASYQIYRSLTADTSFWALVGIRSAGIDQFLDTGLAQATTYYYRVTTKDSATLANQSFFSDSTAASTTTSGIDTSGVNAWYVNDTSTTGDVLTSAIGYDTALGLSVSTPKRTIAAVLPYLTAGDTIFIDAGTYREIVTVTTDSTKYIGADSSLSIFDYNDSTALTAAKGFNLSGRRALLVRNLTIRNYYYGIYGDTTLSSTIENVKLLQNGQDGVRLRYSQGNLVTGARITRNVSIGFYLEQSTANSIRDNYIDSNSTTGIDLINSDSNEIANNRVQGSSTAGIRLISGSETNLLSGNIAVLNSGYGIALSGSSKNTLTSNLADSNSSYGIYFLSNADTNTVTSNFARGNLGDGMNIYVSNGNTISGNTFSSNTLSGLRMDYGSKNTASSNTASSNTDSGITIVGSTGDTLTGNTVSSNGKAGIYVTLASGATIASDTVSSNTKGGIVVDSSTGVVVSGNTVTSNLSEGVYVYGGFGNTIANNTSNANTSRGVYMLSSSNNLISGNTTNSNTGIGIYLDMSSSNTLTGNIANSNMSQGIYLFSNSNNVVSNNTVKSNTNYGLRVQSSSNNTVTSNTFDSNGSWGIYIDGTSAADTFRKNIIIGSPTKPDSGVFNASTVTGARFDFRRNWWGTTDSAAVKAKLHGNPSVNRDSFDYIPYRLAQPDTSATGDTVAPRAPDSVSVVVINSTLLQINWTAVSSSEESEASVGLSGYRVYRSLTSDTTVWQQVGQVSSGSTNFQDTVSSGIPYYYRVTAFDAATKTNESFFSDSISVGSASAEPTQVTTSATLPASANVIAAGVDRTLMMLAEVAGSSTGDTLTKFTVRLTGAAGLDTQVDTVALYKDADENRQFSTTFDVLVANLTRSGFDSWYSTTLSQELPAWKSGKDSFLIVVSLRDTATAGGTVNASIPAGGVKTSKLETGPLTALTSPATFTVVANPTTLLVDPVKPSGAIITPTGLDLTGMLAMSVEGDANDSLTVLAVAFQGTASDSVDTVFLYRDADSNGQFMSGTDQQVTSLTLSGTSYLLPAPVAMGADGKDSFLIVVSMKDAAVANGIVRAYINVNGAKSTSRETVPTANQFAPSQFIIATVGDTRVSVIVSQATSGDTIAPINVDQTRIMAFTVQGNASGDTLQRFEVRLNGNAGDTSRIDYVVLYGDANKDGNLDTSTDSIVTVLGFLGSNHRYGLTNINRWLGSDGAESFLIVVSLKDNAPSGETIWAEIPESTIYMKVADTGPSIAFFAPAQFPVYDLNSPDAFSLTIPATNSETKQTTVNLRWNQASDGGSGIGSYTVEISPSSVFASDTHIANTSLTRSYDTSGLAAGLYYWRVKATDAKGNFRYSSDTNSFRVDLTAPDSVTLSIPGTNAETTLTSINFRWGATATAAFQKYRLQVANDGLFTSLVYDSSTTKDTQGTRTLTAGATYYWRVITQDTAGNESPSDSRRIQIAGSGPTNPSLASPANAFSSRETTMAFSWSASSDSTSTISSYQIQVDQNGLFTSNIVDSGTSTNTSGTVTLNQAGSFFWRVKVTNAAGQSAASTSRTFSIDTGVTLSLVSPSDSSLTNDSRPVFTWTSDGDTFVFQLASDTTTPTIVDSSTQTAKSFQPASILQTRTYYWRVNARDNASNSETSAWRSIGIDTSITVADTLPPNRFYTVSPVSGHCTSVAALRLKWNFTADSGTGVSTYRVQVDSSGLGTFATANIWIDSSVSSAVDTLDVALQSQKTYHWRVIANDGAGLLTIANDSSGFEIKFDTTTPETVALTSPASNADTSVSTIKFTFGTATDTFCGISYYKIQIDTAGTFASPIHDTRATSSPFTVTGFTQDTWYWRLAVVDGAGNQGAWVQDTFKVSLTAPAVPVPDTPVNGVKIGTSVFTFNWNDVVSPIAALRRYNIQITTDATFASVTTAFDTRTSDSTSQISVTGLTTATWYWRVNAEDVAGNKSEWSDTKNFSVDLATIPVPTISAPTANQVMSATSATIKWSVASTPASGIAAYELVIDSTTGTALDTTLTTTATSYTVTVNGFYDGTFYAKVRAKNGAGTWGSFSGTTAFIFDFTPPSAAPTLSSPSNGQETSATIVVFRLAAAGTDTGSGVGQYKFQASKDSAFDTTLIKTSFLTGGTGLEFTPLYLFSDTSCTYFWRVATVDKAGNVGVYSETRWFYKPTPPDTTAPVSIVNLTVTPSSTLGMLLSWSKSPSADMSGGGQYNVYWNNGNDSMQADSLVKVIVDAGTDTYTYEVSNDTTLTNGIFYKFKVQAQDKNGNEENNNATVGAYARFGAASMSYTEIFNPKAGMRIYRPGGVQVMANILGAYRHYAETITFQFRNVNNIAWLDMKGDTSKVGSVNPKRILGDSKTVYGFNWDALNDSTVADTLYELRALITDKFGNLSTTLSGVTVIELTATTANADQILAAGKDTSEIEQKIDSRRSNKIEAQAGADSGMSLSLPADCMDTTTDTSNARVSVEVASAGDTSKNNNDTAKLEIGAAVGSDTPIGVAITINLPSGQRSLNNGKTASISINYPAPDSQGYIPGTKFKPTDLVLRAFGKGDDQYRAWTWDSVTNTASTTLYSIDTTNRTITILVTKFSTFLLVAPAGTAGAPGAQGSLSNLMVYPNPWRPNDGNAATGRHFDIANPRTTGIVFDNLTANVRIEVYNLRGERVFSEVPSTGGQGFATWNVQNKHTGRAVASGYYIYVVTDLATGRRVTGKLAVIR